MIHLKKAQVSMDCLCASLYEPGKFYIANQNKIALAMIDMNLPQTLAVSKAKIKYSDDDDIGSSAIRHTYLSGESADDLE